jgi:hypothetical protein
VRDGGQHGRRVPAQVSFSLLPPKQFFKNSEFSVNPP